jgi:hypothetical protein
VSLTKIERAPGHRLNWAEKAAHARYEKKIARAEADELKMLMRIHKAFTYEGTPFDGDHAARIVGQDAAYFGRSFHESLAIFNFCVTHPSRDFIW